MMKLLNKIKFTWEKIKIWIISLLENDITGIQHINKERRIQRVIGYEFCSYLIKELKNRGFIFVKNKEQNKKRSWNSDWYDMTSLIQESIDENIYIVYDDIYIMEEKSFDSDKYEKVYPKNLFNTLSDDDIIATHDLLLKKEYKEDFFLPSEFFERLNLFLFLWFKKNGGGFKEIKEIKKFKFGSYEFKISKDVSKKLIQFKNPFSAYEYEKIKGDRFSFLADVEQSNNLFGAGTELIGTINPKGNN